MRERVLELVRSGERFLVCCHRRPDADALGSALGLRVLLLALGKDVNLYVPDSLPANLEFLDHGEVEATLPPGKSWDATFVMDTAANALLPSGLPDETRRGPLVVIDHHANHDDVGDIVLREPGACATGEMVMDLAEMFGLRPVPREAATPIYAALVADTGGFRYSSTKPKVLRMGAELLEQGADPWEVAYELFEKWTLERLTLLSAILDTLEVDCDGRLALLTVTRAMLEKAGANDDMVEGMVDYGRKLKGVDIAALVWEFPADDGEGLDTKVSFRSRGEADVGQIAQQLGGGGHRTAAGAQLHEDVDTTRERVREMVCRTLRGD